MEIESSARRKPFPMRAAENAERSGTGVASGIVPAPGHAC